MPVFARMRPPRASGSLLGHKIIETPEDKKAGTLPREVEFVVPRDTDAGLINHQREAFRFNFNGVFDAQAKQDTVFDCTVRDVVLGALDGFNGTIFAYGQTGSGKTYTMTGGDTYGDRGVIPRVISTVFEEFDKRSGSGDGGSGSPRSGGSAAGDGGGGVPGSFGAPPAGAGSGPRQRGFTCYVSFLEIYNETVYDLLDTSHRDKPLEEWNKIQLMDDDYGDLHLRNLRVYEVSSDRDALNLLFLGNVNRMTSSTPMNQASSRSHCVFTLTIEGRDVASDVVRTSKLHLVDLAGSERVYKRAHTGERTTREGKYINLSLHYLEQVIVALMERGKGNRMHIPYRNSMMTSVLRDSLGGNCRTVFLFTLNAEFDFVDESISTCRFAERCSRLSQDVTMNEVVDLNQVIERLQAERKDLEEQLRIARSIGTAQQQAAGNGLAAPAPRTAPITPEERQSLQAAVDQYIRDESPEAALQVADLVQAREAFRILKVRVLSVYYVLCVRFGIRWSSSADDKMPVGMVGLSDGWVGGWVVDWLCCGRRRLLQDVATS